MKGPTHELVGVATAVVGATEVGVPPLGVAIVVAGAYVSSRWPDRFESLFGLPHREQTHYGITALVFTSAVVTGALLAASLVAVAAAAGLATGYVMHLVADSMTPDGTRALWPFVTAKVHLLPAGWRITTGSGAERVFFWLLSAGLVVFVFERYLAGLAPGGRSLSAGWVADVTTAVGRLGVPGVALAVAGVVLVFVAGVSGARR